MGSEKWGFFWDYLMELPAYCVFRKGAIITQYAIRRTQRFLFRAFYNRIA